MGLQVEHRQHKGLNNRARGELLINRPGAGVNAIMKRFKSARQAQTVPDAVHDQVANLFHIPYPESSPCADFRCASREAGEAPLRSGARFPRLLLLPDSRLSENRLVQLSAHLT